MEEFQETAGEIISNLDEQIQEAKKGLIKIILTPFKVVPKEWLGDIVNKNVLCLASGGGQQGPILAAAGSNVTVFDNSDKQLEQDDKAALNYHLKIKTIKGKNPENFLLLELIHFCLLQGLLLLFPTK